MNTRPGLNGMAKPRLLEIARALVIAIAVAGAVVIPVLVNLQASHRNAQLTESGRKASLINQQILKELRAAIAAGPASQRAFLEVNLLAASCVLRLPASGPVTLEQVRACLDQAAEIVARGS